MPSVLDAKRNQSFDDLMTRIRPKLAPGAAAVIRADFDHKANRRSHHADEIGELVDRLSGPAMRHLFKVGSAPAADDPDPLKTALGMVPVRAGAADRLAADWRVDMMAPRRKPDGKLEAPTVGRLVGEVLKRLDKFENRNLLAAPPSLSPRAELVRNVLTTGALARLVDPAKLDDAMLATWGEELGNYAPHEVRRLAAGRLKSSIHSHLTRSGEPVRDGDLDMLSPEFRPPMPAAAPESRPTSLCR